VEEKNLRARVRTDHPLRWLVTIRGLGPHSAALVLAEIGDIRRFPSKRQLYTYAGLVPRVRASAERCGHGHNTRAGPPLCAGF
jgi:transposase